MAEATPSGGGGWGADPAAVVRQGRGGRREEGQQPQGHRTSPSPSPSGPHGRPAAQRRSRVAGAALGFPSGSRRRAACYVSCVFSVMCCSIMLFHGVCVCVKMVCADIMMYRSAYQSMRHECQSDTSQGALRRLAPIFREGPRAWVNIAGQDVKRRYPGPSSFEASLWRAPSC